MKKIIDIPVFILTAMFLTIALFITCSRKNEKIITPRLGGLVADDPVRVSKIPLISSYTDLMAISKGKPIKPPPVPTLPTSFTLLTPTPGTQGNEFSCTPFAVAYGAKSIEQFYRTNATSYSTSTNIFSVEYVYNQTKAITCSGGTSITSCLDLIYNKGVCLESTMPYSDINGCDLMPTAEQDAEAAKYKIINYSRILNTDIVAIKTMIVNKHPVIAGIIADNAFVSAGHGFIWSASTASSGQVGHTVLIVGYDNSKNAYKILNEWGTGWGDEGYSWIDYNFFPTKAGYYTYVMNY